MSLLRAAVTVLATAALGLPGAGAAHAAESGTDPSTRAPIPVGYHFLSGASLAITEPGAPLPGANDWTCRPTADKPRPVVLVHGTLGSGTSNWATYGPLLHNEGYCVYTLTYGATLPAGNVWQPAYNATIALTGQTAGNYITVALVNHQTGKVVAGGNAVLVVGA